MDPITNADRVVALLRQRLKERAGAGRTGGGGRVSRGAGRPEAFGLSAIANLEAVDQRQLRRACVQALLADQFGDGLLNDSRFQQIVARVTDALGEDARSASLLDRVLDDLRGSRGPVA